MRVTVAHGADGAVRVRVEDSLGSAMEAGSGVQVPDDGAVVPPGMMAIVETTDHEGGEPDLDDFAVESIA